MSDLKENPFDFTIFKNWVGLLGNILSIIFFFSPISLIIKVHKGYLSPNNTPYLIMMMNIMNCVLWLSFGILHDEFFLLFCNAVGYSLNSIYLGLFFIYWFKKKIWLIVFLIILSLGISLSCLFFLTYVFKALYVAKYSAMIFNVLIYIAPGQKIVEVFQTRNYKLIPLLNSILGFFCALLWTIYGFLPEENISIIIPNALGILFSIINLITFYYFYSKRSEFDRVDEESIPMIKA